MNDKKSSLLYMRLLIEICFAFRVIESGGTVLTSITEIDHTVIYDDSNIRKITLYDNIDRSVLVRQYSNVEEHVANNMYL